MSRLSALHAVSPVLAEGAYVPSPVSGAYRHTAPVIGTPIDVIDWPTTLRRIDSWAQARESRYVCICNAHSLVTAAGDESFARVLAQADMATSDGAPVTLMLRQLGAPEQRRINGPDLMWLYCASQAARGAKVFLHGGTEHTLEALSHRLRTEFPGLDIVGTYSPPFRPATAQDLADEAQRINDSGAEVVFVGLGCPKQESWMASQRGRVRAVMIGVGAAFDYHAGTVRRAPGWMQHHGLEWLYRLGQEPRRLWKRYLVTNAVFAVLAGWQWLVTRVTGERPAARLGGLPAASVRQRPSA